MGENDQFNKVGLNLASENSWGTLSKLGSSLVKLIGKFFWCLTDFPLMS
jgi:hypothetical protein